MNTNFFQLYFTSFSPIFTQELNEFTTSDPTIDSDSEQYWSNLSKVPMSLMDEQENSKLETVQPQKKRLYWWM